MNLNKKISRRHFLKASGLLGAAACMPFSLPTRAAGSNSHTFVNLTLDGGPDFRHLFVPTFSDDATSYNQAFWKARASAHNVSDSNDLNALRSRYETAYTPKVLGTQSLGVLNQCGWLMQQMDEGNVAVINNAVLSENRDHSHSIIIHESANVLATEHDNEHSGWGGRLSQQAGINMVSVSQNVRLFCNGAKAGAFNQRSNERVIDMSDSRKASLQEFDLATVNNNTNPWRSTWDDAVLMRTLKSFYVGASREVSADSIYAPIFQNASTLRQFGAAIDGRLKGFPIPQALEAFYSSAYRSSNLNRRNFGRQIRNLYDSLLCGDLLNMGIVSMDYGGWDSHKKTPSWIEGRLEDIFGLGKGFDQLFQQIERVSPASLDNLVIMISGEFGRQLSANGTQGTDHGTGTSMLLIGRPVQGGSYGDMFPLSELVTGATGSRHTFAQPNSDIKGLTSMTQVYAQVCEWMQAGTSDLVLPDWRNTRLETGVDLGYLLV